jgi:hypothetical protein
LSVAGRLAFDRVRFKRFQINEFQHGDVAGFQHHGIDWALESFTNPNGIEIIQPSVAGPSRRARNGYAG